MIETIEVIKGTTLSIGIYITDTNGVPYVVGENENLVFGVKRRCESKEYVILRKISIQEDGAYVVELRPTDTEDLPAGEYLYDVGLESGQDFYKVIPPSPFLVLPTVTKWGDR